MEITIENVESALTQFYRTNSTLQAEAHQWLMALQNSSNAWGFVWDLLQPNRSCEAQFFASNTLHLKLVNDWSEVPGDQYDNLKTKLLQTIIAYSSGPKIVLNRLCIALAVYLLRVTPSHWKNSVEDIHNIFQPKNLPNISPERSIWILLEVLAVIPEELNSMTLSHSQRRLVTTELQKSMPLVMVTLENVLSCTNSEVRSLAAKGICSWFTVDTPPALPECLNLATKIVNIVKQAQAVDPYESCEHEIEALSQIMTNQQTKFYKGAIISGLEIILQLNSLLQQTESQEFVMNVYNLFTNFGETHGALLLSYMASNDSRSVESVENLLKCLLSCLSASGSYPRDETRSNLVISFWSTLYDDRNSLKNEEKKIVGDLLEPLYQELCKILLFKSQFPPDGIILTATETEQLRIYRQDIADTIVNCYLFVRHPLISILEMRMANATTWQEVEAVLHIVYSLAETTWNYEEDYDGEDNERGVLLSDRIDEDERNAVISLLVKIPSGLLNGQVVNSLNIAIGAYAEWWISHVEILRQLIPTLVASLQDPNTSTSATMALKDVTRECTTSIKPFAPSLLNSCQEALESGRLREDECVRLMYSVGKLLSILPYDEMVGKLSSIVNYYCTDISNALNQERNSSNKSTIVSRLRMLGNLCSSLYLSEKVNVEPPTLQVLRRLLPLLSAITEQWSSDCTVIEEVSKFLTCCVINPTQRCLSPFIRDIAKIALAGYNAQPNTVMLDLTKQIFTLFAMSDMEFVAGLVRSVSDTTISLALSDQASNCCDVIQAYFALMNTITKRNIQFLQSAISLPNLFNFACVSLTLPEVITVKAAGQLLCSMVTWSRDYQPAVALIEISGENLVETVLRCIGEDVIPRNFLTTMADILLALNKSYCQNLSRWLNSLLSRENFPTPNATSAAKKHFIKTVLREKTTASRVQETVKEFALICRGIGHYIPQPLTPL